MPYRAASPFIKRIKTILVQAIMEKRKSRLKNSIERVDEAVKRAEDWDAAEKIVRGHAWEKHKNEYSEMKTKEDLQKHVENIIRDPDAAKDLENGRKAYWSKDGTIVIENPNDPDGGTVFRTSKGIHRFDKLK